MKSRISHVCYADDDPDDHEIFSAVIKRILPSVTLDSFDSCKCLLEYLKNENNPIPDLIFMDYNMPGEDGNECLQLVRKTARLLHIPVIIYSTSNHPAFIKTCYENGATKYIIKPNTFNEVKTIIEQAIREIEGED